MLAAAELVAPFRPALAAGLRQIRYVSTGTITLAYRRGDIGEPLDGFGLIIPQTERRRINAVTITSSKFESRAPGGYMLIRAFVGGSRNPDVVDLDGQALLALVRDELRDILGIAAAPLWSRVYRWPRGNPQYGPPCTTASRRPAVGVSGVVSGPLGRAGPPVPSR